MLPSRFIASASQGNSHLCARQRQTYRSQERCRSCHLTQLALASRTDAYHARKVLGVKWFARCLGLPLLLALCEPSWADPPHVRTQITEVFTGWNADQFGIFIADPVVNPANCKLATGYMTDDKQPGYRTFYAAALAAFAQRATVIVVVAETECIEDHPKLIGLNILRFP